MLICLYIYSISYLFNYMVYFCCWFCLLKYSVVWLLGQTNFHVCGTLQHRCWQTVDMMHKNHLVRVKKKKKSHNLAENTSFGHDKHVQRQTEVLLKTFSFVATDTAGSYPLLFNDVALTNDKISPVMYKLHCAPTHSSGVVNTSGTGVRKHTCKHAGVSRRQQTAGRLRSSLSVRNQCSSTV